jgi:hypothetical protein
MTARVTERPVLGRCGCRGFHDWRCSGNTARDENIRQLAVAAAARAPRSVMRLRGRQNGRAAEMRRSVAEALERGEHVHVATSPGMFCAGGDPDCQLPRWEGGR